MWIGSEVYIVYIILESVPIFIFMSGVFYIKKKETGFCRIMKLCIMLMMIFIGKTDGTVIRMING